MTKLRSRFVKRLTLLLLCVSTTHLAQGINDPNHSHYVREQMQTHHAGDKIVICKRDGTTLQARIVSIGDESAVVKSSKGVDLPIAYTDVTSVRKAGLSGKAKVWIVIGIVFVTLSVIGTRV